MQSRSCISKVEKEILSLTTPESGMKALAQIRAWHNSLDRMAAVILVSPLLNYFKLRRESKTDSYSKDLLFLACVAFCVITFEPIMI